MERNVSASKEPTYNARTIRLHVHIDWYLRSAIPLDEEGKSWTLEQIQDKLQTSTGIKPGKSTILRRNTQLFQQYQCSPLRRVDYEHYILDSIYYLIAGDKVRPPPSGPGRPRKKYTYGEKQIDNCV